MSGGMEVRTTSIFSMGATVQTECNIQQYCTLHRGMKGEDVLWYLWSVGQ